MADTSKMRWMRRFPEDKHEQILQIMSYLEMCGLSGRDLVSIGGYVDRRAASQRHQYAKERVQDYIDQKTIVPIGADRKDQLENRFKLKTLNGDYNFETNGWSSWEVTNVKTKARKRVDPLDRDWPGHVHWTRRNFYNMVLDIADGNFQANF
jgi:hypothetical protein